MVPALQELEPSFLQHPAPMGRVCLQAGQAPGALWAHGCACASSGTAGESERDGNCIPCDPSHLLGPRGRRSAALSALIREGMVLLMLELGCCVGRNVRFVSSKAGSKREHDFVAW